MGAQTVTLKPERLAQLEAYAQRPGKDMATALDDVLADYLEAEQEEHDTNMQKLSPEGWASELDSLANSVPERPPIPDEALRRENLHSDRF